MMYTVKRPWSVYLFSALALGVLAVFSVGFLHPDEHWQILEFAAWKLGLTDAQKLPWEFHYAMRSTIQPAMVVIIHKAAGLFGCSDPFRITLFLRILTATLSFLAMWMIWRRFCEEIRFRILGKWFFRLSFLLWFALYYAVRFSSETWSGALFIIGYVMLFPRPGQVRDRDHFLAGLMLGLAFLCRFQTGLLIAGFLLWFIVFRRIRPVRFLWIITGILVMVAAGILIDRWFYGYWTWTLWNYFQQNLVAGKMAGFGIQPWYFYFTAVFMKAIPPFSLVIILAFFIYIIAFPKDLLTWTIVPFILFHCLLGHKELRFLLPLTGFLPWMIIRSCGVVAERYRGILSNRYFKGLAGIFWAGNLILIFLSFFNPADKNIFLFRNIYRNFPGPATLYWVNENPYGTPPKTLEINYYKRPELTLKPVDMLKDTTGSGGKYLVLIRHKGPVLQPAEGQKLVYCSFPAWLMRLNINHWVDRSAIWYLFEADPKTYKYKGAETADH